jgi:predicted transcriptional regulator
MTRVRMPDDLMQRLDATAARLRRSKGWIINDAVRAYLEREDLRPLRDEETQEALAELDAGQVVDGDAVLAWIDSPEMLSLVAEIDELKGAWRALGTLAPERLSALRRGATIESASFRPEIGTGIPAVSQTRG